MGHYPFINGIIKNKLSRIIRKETNQRKGWKKQNYTGRRHLNNKWKS